MKEYIHVHTGGNSSGRRKKKGGGGGGGVERERGTERGVGKGESGEGREREREREGGRKKEKTSSMLPWHQKIVTYIYDSYSKLKKTKKHNHKQTGCSTE